MADPVWLDADAVRAALPVAGAVDVLEAALRDGLDPEADAPRSRLAAAGGELLLMPSSSPRYTGAKLVTVAPANPAAGRPLVQGVHVLFDAATLAPLAVLDGAALTALRTPAVSGVALRHLAAPGPSRVVLFGTGPQAHGHAEVLRAVLDVTRVDVVGRSPQAVDRLVRAVRDGGTPAAAAGPAAVAGADVVVCATSAVHPLFDGALLRGSALVVAVGAHTAGTREVDTTTAARSGVVVESRASALREAGDVVVPITEGALRAEDLVGLADVVRGAVRLPLDAPRLFTSTGMAWEDLVVAGAVLEAVLARTTGAHADEMDETRPPGSAGAGLRPSRHPAGRNGP